MSKVREVTINVTCKTETSLPPCEMLTVIESMFYEYDHLNITVSAENGEYSSLINQRGISAEYIEDPITLAQGEKWVRDHFKQEKK